MSYFLQLRRLKKEVNRQLETLQDAEKAGSPETRPRLSGQTEPPNDSDSSLEKGDGGIDAPDLPTDGNDFMHDRYAQIPGIQPKSREDGSEYYLVSWSSADDPENPQNWSHLHRLKTTGLLFIIAFANTAASAIDSAVVTEAATAYGVSEVTETLAGTAMYLFGFSVGALLCSPLSELVGRYWVYLGSMAIFGIWLMASALAPNIGAQIVFRFLAGVFAAPPLTVAGGSISDIWNPREKTWAFPLFGVMAFGGPTLGPVMGGYIGYTGVLSWRWVEWIMLIIDGLVIFLVIAFKEETLAPRLLKYKAEYFRDLTGDDRFQSEHEAKGETLGEVFQISFSRPWQLALEPIVLAFTLYLLVIYIVLFTFLDGYTYIFEEVYGINAGLTNIIFVGLFVGFLLDLVLVPFIYNNTKKQLSRDNDEGQGLKIHRESRLLFAMCGAPAIPIGLFWMGWTDYSSISIWSPIMASVLIGFGIISIFLSAYMYIIDSYETNAASALTFVAVVRYLAAGGMTVVGVPMYKNLGTHYTLTILACISAVAVPIPYALYRWGPKIRGKSQYAVSPGT